MERTYVRRRLAVLLAVAVIAAPWLGRAREAVAGLDPVVPVARETYVVHPGDTLWEIAERLAPGEDPRILVDAIAEANGLDAGSLDVGRTIVIPAR
ncbi:MAG: LysM peptidoglycan-binding domain-containing protein [Actinomycetota bacterium]